MSTSRRAVIYIFRSTNPQVVPALRNKLGESLANGVTFLRELIIHMHSTCDHTELVAIYVASFVVDKKLMRQKNYISIP